MRRSRIIAAAIGSIVLCIALIVYGVYANRTQDLFISNTIGFKPADEVYVSVEGNVTGAIETDITEGEVPAEYESLAEYNRQKGFTYKATFEDTAQNRSRSQTLADWKVKDALNFKRYNIPIVYEITITNYSDLAIEVWIANYNDEDVNFTNTPSCTESNKVTIPAYVRGEQAHSATITMTIVITNVSGGFLNEPNDFLVRMESVDPQNNN